VAKAKKDMGVDRGQWGKEKGIQLRVVRKGET
jgi:hypothetical protein